MSDLEGHPDLTHDQQDEPDNQTETHVISVPSLAELPRAALAARCPCTLGGWLLRPDRPKRRRTISRSRAHCHPENHRLSAL
jgi:hypothetical protein